jgi:hypothetical protein
MCVLIKDLQRSGVYVSANKRVTGKESRRRKALNAEAQRKVEETKKQRGKEKKRKAGFSRYGTRNDPI